MKSNIKAKRQYLKQRLSDMNKNMGNILVYSGINLEVNKLCLIKDISSNYNLDNKSIISLSGEKGLTICFSCFKENVILRIIYGSILDGNIKKESSKEFKCSDCISLLEDSNLIIIVDND